VVLVIGIAALAMRSGGALEWTDEPDEQPDADPAVARYRASGGGATDGREGGRHG
jgi:hypothetical protein